MDDETVIEQLRANAEMVVSLAAERLDVEVGYDEAGVRWMDGFLQRQHEQGDPANREGLINTFGSYLGECLIHTYGGTWAATEHGWGVRFPDRTVAYPFAKTRKQLEDGDGDSVLSFFTVLPHLFRMPT